MHGIVESLPGGVPFADFRSDLLTVLDELSDLLNNWHHRWW